MNDLNDFVRSVLKPRMFANLSTLFPEMEFSPFNGGWKSPKGLYGRKPRKPRHDKCVVTPRCPDRILEQGGDSVELIEYYMSTHNVSKPIDAIKEIASYLRLDVPNGDSAVYERHRERLSKLDAIVRRMQEDIFTKPNKAIEYLRKGRKYADEVTKGMGLGWCSVETASRLLELVDAEQRRNYNTIQFEDYVAIPFKSEGEIMGVVFRKADVYCGKGERYRDLFFSKTASKQYHLFGLSPLPFKGNGEHDKDLICVEGELDALRANYAGVKNVVGISGLELQLDALRIAKEKGVERVILLLDYDKGVYRNEQIDRALNTIRKCGLTGMVAKFPEAGNKVDADSFLVEHSGEELRKIAYDGFVGVIEQLYQIVRFWVVDGDGKPREMSNRDEDMMLRQIANLYYDENLSGWERNRIDDELPKATGNRYTKDALKDKYEQIVEERNRKAQKEKADELLKSVQDLLSKGKVSDALREMQKAKDVEEVARGGEYDEYMQPKTEEMIKTNLKTKQEGLPTGFMFSGSKGKVEWKVPTGALTFICAPTSHGKSRFMQNLALNFAQSDRDGIVLYIHLEEGSTDTTYRLINIYADMQLNNGKQYNLSTIQEYYKGITRFFNKAILPNFEKKANELIRMLSTGKFTLNTLEECPKLRYVEEIEGYVKHVCKKRKVQAVFIDYVQEIYSKAYKGSDRKGELMQICNTLKELSVATQLPFILGAQLNREAVSPLDMSLQQIADASNIEHAANCALLLWDSVVQPTAGKENSYNYSQRSGSGDSAKKEKKLTEEAKALGNRGFTIGVSGKHYAVLAKNRGGERNIDAIIEYDGNTGKVKPHVEDLPIEEKVNEYKPITNEHGDILL